MLAANHFFGSFYLKGIESQRIISELKKKNWLNDCYTQLQVISQVMPNSSSSYTLFM